MSASEIERLFRQEAGRVLATLIRLVGDFDLAEDALQEAFAVALAQWPRVGLPSNPRAWLVNVGRNKAIDRLRRHIRFRAKRQELDAELALADRIAPPPDWDDEVAFEDDMLRLIFTCCHPALNEETRIALTLRAVCSLETPAVARAFLVSEETMAQRLVRAKKKIRDARIPYETPDAALLGERLEGVLAVVYLVFTEGYAVTSGANLLREELSQEAIRLGRLLDALMPRRPAIQGLLALMLLHDARRAGRTTEGGDIILLEDQDRRLWDRDQIAEGLELVDAALRAPGRPTSYGVQAAIAALHARSPHYETTDWKQIVGLYEVLLRIHPSPVIELNHAAALSMVDGPARALDLLDALAARGGLDLYHLLPAARADLLRRLGRREEAREAYGTALALVKLDPERRLLTKRLTELG